MAEYQSIFRPSLFTGQQIIITGGGSGIGRCTAHELASLGANLILIGRNEDKLKQVAKEIKTDNQSVGQNNDVHWYSADIRDEERVCALVTEIVTKHGRIHGLVNNAGGQYPSLLENTSRNGFRAVIETNLTGGFLFAREAFKQCMKTHGGAIVNITADCINGFPGLGHTGAARAGMENLTKTAAWEWGRYGVRVNALAPGIVASSGLSSYPKEFHQRILNMGEYVPLHRLCTEAEVSAGIVFLLSPGAAYINGTTLHIDGGGQFGSSHMYLPLPETDLDHAEIFDGFHRSNFDDIVNGDT
ncbi:putative 2,4-dienoyl-CoA reductase [BD1-7 clade bacterium]|nr:putative 2,4-dienoyl-CoA reductase [BD1-7 clade bacterium]